MMRRQVGVVLQEDGSVDAVATAAQRRDLAHRKPVARTGGESGSAYQELDFIPG